MACMRCARLPRSSEMFDLRYHVASLAAVFLALIIGILVGVGISDQGLVRKARRSLLEERVANLQARLDDSSRRSSQAAREREAAKTFVNEAYPVLIHGRLQGKRIAVLDAFPAGLVAGALRRAQATGERGSTWISPRPPARAHAPLPPGPVRG